VREVERGRREREEREEGGELRDEQQFYKQFPFPSHLPTVLVEVRHLT